MFRWLSKPVTPTGFDASFGAVGGIGCLAIAAVNAAYGYWWPAVAFAVIAAGPLFHVYRYIRHRQVERSATPTQSDE